MFPLDRDPYRYDYGTPYDCPTCSQYRATERTSIRTAPDAAGVTHGTTTAATTRDTPAWRGASGEVFHFDDPRKPNPLGCALALALMAAFLIAVLVLALGGFANGG